MATTSLILVNVLLYPGKKREEERNQAELLEADRRRAEINVQPQDAADEAAARGAEMKEEKEEEKEEPLPEGSSGIIGGAVDAIVGFLSGLAKDLDAADEAAARSAEMKIAEKTAIDASLEKEHADLEVLVKTTKVKSMPVIAKRSHAAVQRTDSAGQGSKPKESAPAKSGSGRPEPTPSLTAIDSAPSVAVSALRMGSAVPIAVSGSEFKVKVSPGTRAEYVDFFCGDQTLRCIGSVQGTHPGAQKRSVVSR